MSLKEIVLKNRSYRRFYQDRKVSVKELEELVDIARNVASGANRQPLRYKVVCDASDNEKVFSTLKWAAALTDWDGPKEGEKPAGYIIICSPVDVQAPRDEGIAAQTILLSATEKGLGGCMFASVNIPKLNKRLELPSELSARLVIAIGYPKEEVVIEEVSCTDNLKYYRDEENVHHVPKLKLEDVLL